MRAKILATAFVSTLLGSFFVIKSFAISFSLANPSLVINGEGIEEITLDASISGSTAYYLQGMLTKTNQTPEYFGWTKDNYGSFTRYVSDSGLDPDYIKTNFFKTSPQNGFWSGQIVIKNDPADDGYKGSGNYTLRLKRYTGASSSGTYADNDLNVNLVFAYPTPTLTPTSSPTPTQAPSSTPTSKATPTPTTKISPTLTPTKKPTTTPTLEPSDLADQTLEEEGSFVLGSSDPTPTPIPEDTAKNKPPLIPIVAIFAGLLLVLGAIFLLVRNHLNDRDGKMIKHE